MIGGLRFVKFFVDFLNIFAQNLSIDSIGKSTNYK